MTWNETRGVIDFYTVNLKKREVVEKQEVDKNVKIKFIDNAWNFTHLLFLILINIVTKFSAPKILFRVILWESQSELCAKNVANIFFFSFLSISCAQNSFSRNIMRITIRAMCQKRSELNEQILYCRSELSKICSVVLVQSIRAKIQDANFELFNHLNQINAQKLG